MCFVKVAASRGVVLLVVFCCAICFALFLDGVVTPRILLLKACGHWVLLGRSRAVSEATIQVLRFTFLCRV